MNKKNNKVIVYNKTKMKSKIKFKNTAEEYMINYLANKIRNIVGQYEDPFLYGVNENYYKDNPDKFQNLKECCLYIDELLSYKSINERVMEMANNDSSDEDNKKNNDIKYEMFSTLRNIFIHFLNFNTWDDVYINKELLFWNEPNFSQIYSFFNKNKGKELKYTIYRKKEVINKWEPAKTITINIPNHIPSNEKLYLHTFISFDDVITTLHIIDYYLDYLGLDLIQYQYLSI